MSYGQLLERSPSLGVGLAALIEAFAEVLDMHGIDD